MNRVPNSVVAIALIAGLTAGGFDHAFAQQSKPPVKPWEQPVPPNPNRPPTPGSQPPFVPGGAGSPPSQPPPQQAPPPATQSPVIARVEGRPITQRDYDQIAEPYFVRLKAQLGDAFSGDLKKTAIHNVLDELIRRQMLVIEAERQKIEVSEAELDEVLAQDPFFATNGKFDPGKLSQFKISPQSNYRNIVPRLREVVMAEKMDRKIRAQLAPSPAVVRAEWSKRNEQVRFKYLPITTRDVSLDPESDEAEQLAYYQAHPDQFEKKARLGLRYVRLPLPAEGDSLRPSEEAKQKTHARGIADSLRRGTPLDTLAIAFGGAIETGLFDLPATSIPSLGRPEEILEQLKRAESDTTLRVLGPSVTPAGVVVAVVSAREAKRMPPFAEVRGDVKRRADAEKRRTQLEADKLAYYTEHRDDFKTARAQVTRVLLNPAAVQVKASSNAETDRWYAQHGRELFEGDSARTQSPPAISDSLRGVVRARLEAEARNTRVAAGLGRIAAGLGRNPRGAWSLARAEGATADTLTFVKDAARDSVFSSSLVDSLVGSEGRAQLGVLQGPRRFGLYEVLWRVDAVDTSFVPGFEAARSHVERAFQEDRRAKDEAEAKVWFDAHQTDYKTKPKWVIDYVQVKIPSTDSVPVADAAIERFWKLHQKDRFRQDEEVRARHILISPPQGAVGSDDAKLKARADSLRTAIVQGADFAELARNFSQDPGSGAQGGDLGFFGKGRMVKEFSDTSFALPVGRVSQPVKTRFGYHLIEVQEKKTEGIKPLAEVRAEIRTELAREQADSLGLRNAKRMLRQIATAGAIAATKSAGGVQTSPPLAASDPIPGVGPVPELGAGLEKLALGAWSQKPYKQATTYLLVRPTKRIAAGQAEFEEVKRQAVEDMKTAKKKELVAKKVAAVRAQLTAGASLDSAAAIFGGLKDSGLLTRGGGFIPTLGSEPRVLDKAFALKPGTASDTLQVAQGVVWLRTEEKKSLEGASFAKDKDQITNEMLAKSMEEWLQKKKKSVRLEVLRADLREPPPPKFKTVTTTIPG